MTDRVGGQFVTAARHDTMPDAPRPSGKADHHRGGKGVRNCFDQKRFRTPFLPAESCN